MLKNLVLYPDERLREACLPIDDFGDSLQSLLKDLEDTMYASGGIGISAPQIGVSQQVFVLDNHFFGAPKKLFYINPVILHKTIETDVEEEGCLSFPDIFLKIERPIGIVLSYQDEAGTKHEEFIRGFHARAIQHENDHLTGKVFLDYVSSLKKNLVEKKLKKRNKK